MKTVTEYQATKINGYPGLGILILAIFADVAAIIAGIRTEDTTLLFIIIPLGIFWFIWMLGLFIVRPNEARVLVLFGKYIGTVRDAGFWWANPFAVKMKVSLRIRNFNSEKIKVNDIHGNPIEIAAVVVWHVVDSSRALFDVDNYEQFVALQAETAIRTLATEYPYDAQDGERSSLRGNQQEIADALKVMLQTRLEIAGVEVIESRLSHLAYSPEIAQAMLRRQQAQAIIAARKLIVEGAVGMVDQALKSLAEQHIVTLDEEKKATMVNNLLVALVSESQAQPVINTGSLY